MEEFNDDFSDESEENMDYIEKRNLRLELAAGSRDYSVTGRTSDIALGLDNYLALAMKSSEIVDQHKTSQLLYLHNCSYKELLDERTAEVVDQLVRLGSPMNPSVGRIVALHEAVVWGYPRMRAVEILLDSGVHVDEPDIDGLTSLGRCIYFCPDPEMARYLISRGARVDTSFLLSAFDLEVPGEIVESLMLAHPDAAIRNDLDFAYLYRGKRPREELIECLLNLGVDPNARSLDGQSFLFASFSGMSLGYLRYLVLVCGVDLNTRNEWEGCTVLAHMRRVIPNPRGQLRDELAEKFRLCLMRGADADSECWLDSQDMSRLTDGELVVFERLDNWLDLRMEQIALRELMNQPVNERIVRALYSDGFCAAYLATCKLELVALMDAQIYNRISLFDILTNSDEKMTSYMGNEELLAALEKFRGERMFFIYLPYLNERVEQFLYLRGIRDKAAKVLGRTLGGLVNDVIVEQIAKRLTIRDLHKLSKFYTE